MARKSKLTESQWEDIKKRLLSGEPRRVIAREYLISEAAIRQRLSSQVEEIKDVAKQIVKTESALAKLPVTSQVYARSLADSLRAISNDLACAAGYGAATAHRLAGVAHMKASEVDDASPLTGEGSLEAIKGIAVLTRTANESAQLGIELLRANKGILDDPNDLPILQDPDKDI